MVRIAAATCIVALVPLVASAQGEFEGLDLSDDAPKPDETSETSTSTDATTVQPKPTPAQTKPAKDANEPMVERDITQEDRVKSVQRKLYIKRGRFELGPDAGLSINDPFYTKYQVSARVAYYMADTLAFAARGSLMQLVPSDDVSTAKRYFFNSQIYRSLPIWSVMGDLEWSPLYGKIAIFNSILHFDAFIVGGAGIVITETSSATDQVDVGGVIRNEERGPAFAADLGLGMRFVVKDFLAIRVSLVNTTYVDQPKGTSKGATQNLMMLSVGPSFFLPPKSTYREEE